MTLVRVACPVCGPSDARPWRRQPPFTVVRCLGCGLGITWPAPTDADLERFYAPGYYERDHMGAENAAAWGARAAGILDRVGVPVARVLDVGAGQGHMVAALRACGVQAEGVETLEAGRSAARTLHGLELRASWPDAADGSYDLVTLVHVLEHVRDPAGMLAAAAAQVRPGGMLFVDVPHAASVEMWRPEARRQILSLPGHLFHFTPDPLRALVTRAGWNVRDVYLLNPPQLEWLLALRARRKRRAGPSHASPEPAPRDGGLATSAATAPAHGLRALWRGRALPWIRTRFPGHRFELVAVRL